MDAEVRPPIPATCASRPTVGGVVAPWANCELADGGYDFRAQHDSKVQRCWTQGLCQVCGQLLTVPMVIFGGPRQVAAMTFDEPPLHPECAAYTSKACPMIAGRQERYAVRETIVAGHRGATCFDPGCDCGGYVPTPGTTAAPGGDPAHDWYALYVSGYSLGVVPTRPNRVHAGVIRRHEVLGVRHVSAPGNGRVWKKIDLEDIRV